MAWADYYTDRVFCVLEFIEKFEILLDGGGGDEEAQSIFNFY